MVKQMLSQASQQDRSSSTVSLESTVIIRRPIPIRPTVAKGGPADLLSVSDKSKGIAKAQGVESTFKVADQIEPVIEEEQEPAVETQTKKKAFKFVSHEKRIEIIFEHVHHGISIR